MNNGQYTITLDPERGLVRVVARGVFDRVLGEELITSARKTAAKHHYNILCDVRESHTRAGLADWYFLPRRLLVYLGSKTRGIKTAIIVATGEQERTYRFFETVTRNLGMNIRIFLRQEEALEWLHNFSKEGAERSE